LPFYAAENTFLLNQKDFFSETTAKCTKKRYKLAIFAKIKTDFQTASKVVSEIPYTLQSFN